MEKINEKEIKFRDGDSGPKYLIKGPFWDGGIILLKPGQAIGAHFHNKVEETFYFFEGSGKILVNDVAYTIQPGDVYRINPGEKHDIVNKSKEVIRCLFIKCPYLPDDRVKA